MSGAVARATARHGRAGAALPRIPGRGWRPDQPPGAALQHATSAPWPERPVLLRREREVGHGARAASRSVTLSADTLAFLAAQTGLKL